MNIRPLADRVLIQPAAAEEVTVSGIIIPDSAKEKPLKGNVLAVGNAQRTKRWSSRKAIQSFTANMQEQKSSLTEKKYLIMRQNDVLAVIG